MKSLGVGVLFELRGYISTYVMKCIIVSKYTVYKNVYKISSKTFDVSK